MTATPATVAYDSTHFHTHEEMTALLGGGRRSTRH